MSLFQVTKNFFLDSGGNPIFNKRIEEIREKGFPSPSERNPFITDAIFEWYDFSQEILPYEDFTFVWKMYDLECYIYKEGAFLVKEITPYLMKVQILQSIIYPTNVFNPDLICLLDPKERSVLREKFERAMIVLDHLEEIGLQKI